MDHHHNLKDIVAVVTQDGIILGVATVIRIREK